MVDYLVLLMQKDVLLVYGNKSNTAKLVRLRYILSQKGNSNNMDHLAEVFGGKKHLLKSYGGYNVTVNTTKLSPIVQYFNLYPSFFLFLLRYKLDITL